jgi:hypothetical protein
MAGRRQAGDPHPMEQELRECLEETRVLAACHDGRVVEEAKHHPRKLRIKQEKPL